MEKVGLRLLRPRRLEQEEAALAQVAAGRGLLRALAQERVARLAEEALGEQELEAELREPLQRGRWLHC